MKNLLLHIPLETGFPMHLIPVTWPGVQDGNAQSPLKPERYSGFAAMQYRVIISVTGMVKNFKNALCNGCGWGKHMKILFATNDYFPQTGGLQASIHDLIPRLEDLGHSCAVLIPATPKDLKRPAVMAKRIIRKLIKRPFIIHDRKLPYTVFRAPHPPENLSMVKDIYKPDVIVCVIGGTHTIGFVKNICKTAGDTPIMVYIFDIEGVAFTADPLCSRCHVVANSEAIASLIAAHRPRPPFIPCIVAFNDYRVNSTREIVLYINPHPRKGEELAWKIAEASRDKGLRFVFQENWYLNDERTMEIKNRAQKLGNVEFRKRAERAVNIYRDARVLLAPYGPEKPRVVDEAQANGIPVVASDVPGLDECVGPGGVLVDPEGPVDTWVSILERLHNDELYYKEMADAAIRHSRRPEIQPEYIARCFERELQRVTMIPQV